MRYLIIGLGIYGSNLAIDLTEMGHEVIGADIQAALVESIKDFISTAYIVDSTDRVALSALPLMNVDTVIVAIGENFGASIRTVALLKELGVKHIYARGIDRLHEAILEGFHIDRILTPEQRAALDLTREMAVGQTVDSLAIDDADEHFVLKFPLPDVFEGLRYDDIPVLKGGDMKLIAVCRSSTGANVVGVVRDTHSLLPLSDGEELPRAVKGDVVTVFTTRKAFRNFTSSL
ncbi:MAG: TrkA family potassium uptake protein [Pseudoflavonifractor sp.]|nr:TrkA family potassium uptake protein [Alloprevotella sp.]MCM1116211.1 TrkA family potassium uptake protein [Pseudoflavonifractor sp.]